MLRADSRALREKMDFYVSRIEERLGSFFSGSPAHKGLTEAMRYSLLAGGKRIRPVMTLAFCEAAGGACEDALDMACAVEMLHTYSLIHDDLPSMDDDELRRGKPTSHVVYGEAVAILAGDALQASAFDALLNAGLSDKQLAAAGRELSRAAGADGICGGQYLDIVSTGKTLSADELMKINSMKTSGMFTAAARIGVIAAEGTDEQIKAASEYARSIGMAFQIKDDLLDFESTTAELGKPVNSDLANNKSTFGREFGIERCREIIHNETQKCINSVTRNFDDSEFLVWLAQIMEERKY